MIDPMDQPASSSSSSSYCSPFSFNNPETGCFSFGNNTKNSGNGSSSILSTTAGKRRQPATLSDNNNNKKKNDNNNDSSLISRRGDKGKVSIAELANELNALTVHEREQIFDEIHGVAEISCSHQETPEFVQECLHKFHAAIQDIPQKRRHALDRAIFLKPSMMTQDVDFLMMFARADQYDIPKAAKRLRKYFQDKLELFGESKLVKKITLDDLNEQDMKMLRSGVFMVLPFQDSSGRPMWLHDFPKYDLTYPKSVIRGSWYQVMATLEDENVHKKGVADIVHCSGASFPKNINTFRNMAGFLAKGGDMLVNIPCRVTCYHLCYNNHAVKYLESVMRHALGRQCGLRLRAHLGSDIEIQYSLMTFGINCPSMFNDEEKQKLHQDYLQKRFELDRQYMEQERIQSTKTTGNILYPAPNDVLVGRGRPYQDFSGNQMLIRLIDSTFLERYIRTKDRFERTCIHMEVVKTIQESFDGRFIERTPIGWKVVDDQTARKKIFSAFRTRTAKAPAATTNSTSTASRNMEDDLDGIGLDNPMDDDPLSTPVSKSIFDATFERANKRFRVNYAKIVGTN